MASGSPLHWVIERLYRVKLAAGAKPHLLASVKYADDFDIRAFHDPRLSPSGAYVITSTTGSDISVHYTVRSAATGKVRRTVNTELPGRDVDRLEQPGRPRRILEHAARRQHGHHQLIIFNPTTNAAARLRQAVAGRGHRPCLVVDDALLAYSLRGLQAADDVAELWTIDPATFGAQTDLGPGSFPVFMPGS